jgi:hypothetical protein
VFSISRFPFDYSPGDVLEFYQNGRNHNNTFSVVTDVFDCDPYLQIFLATPFAVGGDAACKAVELFAPTVREVNVARHLAVDSDDFVAVAIEIQFGWREDLLREQSIHTYTYDDHDCRIKSESYEPGMKLSRTEDVRCLDGTATPRLTTIRDARGVKQAETSHNSGQVGLLCSRREAA